MDPKLVEFCFHIETGDFGICGNSDTLICILMEIIGSHNTGTFYDLDDVPDDQTYFLPIGIQLLKKNKSDDELREEFKKTKLCNVDEILSINQELIAKSIKSNIHFGFCLDRYQIIKSKDNGYFGYRINEEGIEEYGLAYNSIKLATAMGMEDEDCKKVMRNKMSVKESVIFHPFGAILHGSPDCCIIKKCDFYYIPGLKGQKLRNGEQNIVALQDTTLVYNELEGEGELAPRGIYFNAKLPESLTNTDKTEKDEKIDKKPDKVIKEKLKINANSENTHSVSPMPSITTRVSRTVSKGSTDIVNDAKFIEHWEILKSYNWMRRNPRKDYILSDQEWYSVPLPIKYMFNDDPIRNLVYFPEKEGLLKHLKKYPFLSFYWNDASAQMCKAENKHPFLSDVLIPNGWSVDMKTNLVLYKPNCRKHIFEPVLKAYKQLLSNRDIFPFFWSKNNQGLVGSKEYGFLSEYPVMGIHKFDNTTNGIQLFRSYIQRFPYLVDQSDDEMHVCIQKCGWVKDLTDGSSISYYSNAAHFQDTIHLSFDSMEQMRILFWLIPWLLHSPKNTCRSVYNGIVEHDLLYRAMEGEDEQLEGTEIEHSAKGSDNKSKPMVTEDSSETPHKKNGRKVKTPIISVHHTSQDAPVNCKKISHSNLMSNNTHPNSNNLSPSKSLSPSKANGLEVLLQRDRDNRKLDVDNSDTITGIIEIAKVIGFQCVKITQSNMNCNIWWRDVEYCWLAPGSVMTFEKSRNWNDFTKKSVLGRDFFYDVDDVKAYLYCYHKAFISNANFPKGLKDKITVVHDITKPEYTLERRIHHITHLNLNPTTIFKLYSLEGLLKYSGWEEKLTPWKVTIPSWYTESVALLPDFYKIYQLNVHYFKGGIHLNTDIVKYLRENGLKEKDAGRVSDDKRLNRRYVSNALPTPTRSSSKQLKEKESQIEVALQSVQEHMEKGFVKLHFPELLNSLQATGWKLAYPKGHAAFNEIYVPYWSIDAYFLEDKAENHTLTNMNLKFDYFITKEEVVAHLSKYGNKPRSNMMLTPEEKRTRVSIYANAGVPNKKKTEKVEKTMEELEMEEQEREQKVFNRLNKKVSSALKSVTMSMSQDSMSKLPIGQVKLHFPELLNSLQATGWKLAYPKGHAAFNEIYVPYWSIDAYFLEDKAENHTLAGMVDTRHYFISKEAVVHYLSKYGNFEIDNLEKSPEEKRRRGFVLAGNASTTSASTVNKKRAQENVGVVSSPKRSKTVEKDSKSSRSHVKSKQRNEVNEAVDQEAEEPEEEEHPLVQALGSIEWRNNTPSGFANLFKILKMEGWRMVYPKSEWFKAINSCSIEGEPVVIPSWSMENSKWLEPSNLICNVDYFIQNADVVEYLNKNQNIRREVAVPQGRQKTKNGSNRQYFEFSNEMKKASTAMNNCNQNNHKNMTTTSSNTSNTKDTTIMDNTKASTNNKEHRLTQLKPKQKKMGVDKRPKVDISEIYTRKPVDEITEEEMKYFSPNFLQETQKLYLYAMQGKLNILEFDVLGNLDDFDIYQDLETAVWYVLMDMGWVYKGLSILNTESDYIIISPEMYKEFKFTGEGIDFFQYKNDDAFHAKYHLNRDYFFSESNLTEFIIQQGACFGYDAYQIYEEFVNVIKGDIRIEDLNDNFKMYGNMQKLMNEYEFSKQPPVTCETVFESEMLKEQPDFQLVYNILKSNEEWTSKYINRVLHTTADADLIPQNIVAHLQWLEDQEEEDAVGTHSQEYYDRMELDDSDAHLHQHDSDEVNRLIFDANNYSVVTPVVSPVNHNSGSVSEVITCHDGSDDGSDDGNDMENDALSCSYALPVSKYSPFIPDKVSNYHTASAMVDNCCEHGSTPIQDSPCYADDENCMSDPEMSISGIDTEFKMDINSSFADENDAMDTEEAPSTTATTIVSRSTAIRHQHKLSSGMNMCDIIKSVHSDSKTDTDDSMDNSELDYKLSTANLDKFELNNPNECPTKQNTNSSSSDNANEMTCDEAIVMELEKTTPDVDNIIALLKLNKGWEWDYCKSKKYKNADIPIRYLYGHGFDDGECKIVLHPNFIKNKLINPIYNEDFFLNKYSLLDYLKTQYGLQRESSFDSDEEREENANRSRSRSCRRNSESCAASSATVAVTHAAVGKRKRSQSTVSIAESNCSESSDSGKDASAVTPPSTIPKTAVKQWNKDAIVDRGVDTVPINEHIAQKPVLNATAIDSTENITKVENKKALEIAQMTTLQRIEKASERITLTDGMHSLVTEEENLIVSRQTETKQLFDLMYHSVENKSPCLINVHGPASFGKTTVVKHAATEVVKAFAKLKMESENTTIDNNTKSRRCNNGVSIRMPTPKNHSSSSKNQHHSKSESNTIPTPALIMRTNPIGLYTEIQDTLKDCMHNQRSLIYVVDEADLCTNLHVSANHAAGSGGMSKQFQELKKCMKIASQQHTNLVLVCIGNTAMFLNEADTSISDDMSNLLNDAEYRRLISENELRNTLHVMHFGRYTVSQLENILHARLDGYLDVQGNNKGIEMLARKAETESYSTRFMFQILQPLLLDKKNALLETIHNKAQPPSNTLTLEPMELYSFINKSMAKHKKCDSMASFTCIRCNRLFHVFHDMHYYNAAIKFSKTNICNAYHSFIQRKGFDDDEHVSNNDLIRCIEDHMIPNQFVNKSTSRGKKKWNDDIPCYTIPLTEEEYLDYVKAAKLKNEKLANYTSKYRVNSVDDAVLNAVENHDQTIDKKFTNSSDSNGLVRAKTPVKSMNAVPIIPGSISFNKKSRPIMAATQMRNHRVDDVAKDSFINSAFNSIKTFIGV